MVPCEKYYYYSIWVGKVQHELDNFTMDVGICVIFYIK